MERKSEGSTDSHAELQPPLQSFDDAVPDTEPIPEPSPRTHSGIAGAAASAPIGATAAVSMLRTRSVTRRTTLLGLPIDQCSRVELRAWIRRCLDGEQSRRVITVNPEIIVAAVRSPTYAAVLQTADLLTVDGVGIQLALRMRGAGHPERITGVDLFEEFATVAAEVQQTVVVLLRPGGRTPPPLLRTALHARWPSLPLAIAIADPHVPPDASLVQAINEHTPAVLVTDFGHPVQEQWIARHVDRFPSVRVAAGIGGAVDVLAGTVAVPPPTIRRLGLEWGWRAMHEPWRMRRILRATLVFPGMLVAERIGALVGRFRIRRAHARAVAS